MKNPSNNPFTRYIIYLEEILSPQKKAVIYAELVAKGWIPYQLNYRKSKENSFLEILCTPMHLGRVVDHIMQSQGWCIVERVNPKK